MKKRHNTDWKRLCAAITLSIMACAVSYTPAYAFVDNSGAVSNGGLVAIGTDAQASEDNAVAIGDSAQATGDSAYALGDRAQASASNSVALGSGSVVAEDDGNVISVGNTGSERRIIHVAEGVADTDAVNFGQLKAAVNNINAGIGGINGKDGLDANSQKITNVADGDISEGSKDAVNGGQLYDAVQKAEQNNNAQIANIDRRLSKLGTRVNKVGAGAAALAALHPLDFDPDDKLSISVGMGNYGGENAAAIGAFYRPNEKVMMSVAGTYGNGENMVNMGLSFALDKPSNVNNSRTAMAKEIVELRGHVAQQAQQIAQLTALVNKLVGSEAVKGEGVLFPDVPENHWAYEYINDLVQAGVIDGYSDSSVNGDRSMTRFEFAAMLDKAILQGVVLRSDIVKEFSGELSRIRIDRAPGEGVGAKELERVRVNKGI